jgi:threonine/homoserine/homoserine lactone efflux protein
MISTFLAIFASSFVIALSGALMPGPLLTATISESSRRGFMAGPLLMVGHGMLEMALVIALLLGLAPYLQQPGVFAATALAGAVTLLWMAYGMFRSLPSLSLLSQGERKGGPHPIAGGILMSAANPYWIIWWATIGMGYILYSRQYGIWGVAFFFAGHILADLAWYSAVATAVSRGRHLLTDRLYRGLIAGCAVFLVLLAVYFAYAGLQKCSGIAA